jgi:hypothetical protein
VLISLLVRRSNDSGAAAVDAQVGAVDVAGWRAGDEGPEVGHFFWSAESARRVVEDLGQDARLDLRPVLAPAPAAGFKAVCRDVGDVQRKPVLRCRVIPAPVGERAGVVDQDV